MPTLYQVRGFADETEFKVSSAEVISAKQTPTGYMVKRQVGGRMRVTHEQIGILYPVTSGRSGCIIIEAFAYEDDIERVKKLIEDTLASAVMSRYDQAEQMKAALDKWRSNG